MQNAGWQNNPAQNRPVQNTGWQNNPAQNIGWQNSPVRNTPTQAPALSNPFNFDYNDNDYNNYNDY